jgi:hypothetical protein
MSSDPSKGLLDQAHHIPRKPLRFQMDESLRKRQETVTETDDLITYHNDKLFTSSSSLGGSDKTPPERHDTNSSLTSQQLMNYSSDPTPFATNTFARYSHFLGLIVTTVLSTLVFFGSLRKYVVPLSTQKWIDNNDANVAMIVQIVATLLGYLMTIPLTSLVCSSFLLCFIDLMNFTQLYQNMLIR